MAGDTELANLCLVLEHELRRAKERNALLERTIEMLQNELLKAAEDMIELRKEQEK
jgi:hypothetical protein